MARVALKKAKNIFCASVAYFEAHIQWLKSSFSAFKQFFIFSHHKREKRRKIKNTHKRVYQHSSTTLFFILYFRLFKSTYPKYVSNNTLVYVSFFILTHIVYCSFVTKSHFFLTTPTFCLAAELYSSIIFIPTAKFLTLSLFQPTGFSICIIESLPYTHCW